MTYGSEMRKWRKAKNMTQMDLGRILGITGRTIQNIENERTESPYKIRTLFANLQKRHAQEPIKL